MSSITYRPKVSGNFGVKPVVEPLNSFSDLLYPTYNVISDVIWNVELVVLYTWALYNVAYWYMAWCFFWGLTWAPWMWIPFGVYGWTTYFIINFCFATVFFLPVLGKLVIEFILRKYKKYENNI